MAERLGLFFLGREVAPHGIDESVARNGRPGYPAIAAVLVPASVVEAQESQAFGELFCAFEGLVEVVGMDEFDIAVPDEFLVRPAQHGGPGRVHGRDDPVETEHQHDVG